MDDVVLPAIMITFSTLMIAVLTHLTRAMSRAGTLHRNRAVGIKTRPTLSSDDAWTRGHAAAEPWLLAAALCGYTTAASATLLLVLAAFAELSPVAALVVAIIGFLGTTALIIAGGVVGNSAAHEIDQPLPDAADRQQPGD